MLFGSSSSSSSNCICINIYIYVYICIRGDAALGLGDRRHQGHENR